METQDPSALLSDLLVGARVSGVRFGALQLLLSPPTRTGEIYINVSSAFQVFDSRPGSFPASEDDVPEQTQEAELLSLFDLRFAAITHVEIIGPERHLVLTFADDAVLYINGDNSCPEPWHVGLIAPDPSESVQILAFSGAPPIVF